MYYCSNTRLRARNNFNLSHEQEKVFFKAFTQIELGIAELLTAFNGHANNLRISDNGNLKSLPQLQKQIFMNSCPKKLNAFFSAFRFSENYEKFIKRCFKLGIKTTSDIYSSGFIVHTDSNLNYDKPIETEYQ